MRWTVKHANVLDEPATDPAVVSDIICTRGGIIAAAGYDVRTPQLKFVSETEVALRSLYEVDVVSCGELLLSLGGVLGR
jgi:hypothetical protein